jgi:NAD(P)-dependent dehydrogenase (short-subunit alcohol dehydrogenase family)
MVARSGGGHLTGTIAAINLTTNCFYDANMNDCKFSMNDKVCLVTGATSGIGKAIAVALADLGATVVLVGRNLEKSKRLCAQFRRSNSSAQVDYMIADLSSQHDIYQLAVQFNKKYQRLDLLVNNAGAKFVSRLTSVDGYEMTFALNHMAYFLLTDLLLDRLKAAGNARIINISSGAHTGQSINFDDLQNVKGYVGKVAYGQSKLANLLFTYELARRLNGTGMTVNAMAPGGVITNFCRNNGWISWGKHLLAHIIARNLIGPGKAAEAVVYLACSKQVNEITGKYYYNKTPVNSSAASYDAECAKRLWEISDGLIKQEYRQR